MVFNFLSFCRGHLVLPINSKSVCDILGHKLKVRLALFDLEKQISYQV